MSNFGRPNIQLCKLSELLFFVFPTERSRRTEGITFDVNVNSNFYALPIVTSVAVTMILDVQRYRTLAVIVTLILATSFNGMRAF
jgi:hypothetical protein